jgi:hypothetical protein
LIPRSLLRSLLRTNTWVLTRIQSITLQNQHTSELAPGLLIPVMRSPRTFHTMFFLLLHISVSCYSIY